MSHYDASHLNHYVELAFLLSLFVQPLKNPIMSLIKWNQPSPLTGKRNWIENFFAETDDFFKNWDWDRSNNVPAINVKEEKDAYLIEMAAPGMKKEDFKIDVEGNMLTISSEREETKEEKDKKFTRKEYNYSSFSRSFTLPDEVNREKIDAKYEDGVLKLTLPRREEVKNPTAKQIAVK